MRYFIWIKFLFYFTPSEIEWKHIVQTKGLFVFGVIQMGHWNGKWESHMFRLIYWAMERFRCEWCNACSTAWNIDMSSGAPCTLHSCWRQSWRLRAVLHPERWFPVKERQSAQPRASNPRREGWERGGRSVKIGNGCKLYCKSQNLLQKLQLFRKKDFGCEHTTALDFEELSVQQISNLTKSVKHGTSLHEIRDQCHIRAFKIELRESIQHWMRLSVKRKNYSKGKDYSKNITVKEKWKMDREK